MTFSTFAIAKFLLLANFVSSSSGFVHVHNLVGNEVAATTSTSLFADAPPKKKPLTSAEILARARAKAGIEEDEPPPKIFEDDLLDDMQQLLLILEKRVKEGPGSIPLLEVEQFKALSSNILKEMKDKEDYRMSGVASAYANATPVADAKMEKGPASPTAPAPATPVVEAVQTKTEEPPEVLAEPSVVAGMAEPKQKIDIDTPADEGEAYDGTGGMGMAKGTASTYVIPGMDEMEPEEYRKALQQSIIDRQTNRKKSGRYGNRATWDYLNNLTGESGVLRDDQTD